MELPTVEQLAYLRQNGRFANEVSDKEDKEDKLVIPKADEEAAEKRADILKNWKKGQP